MRSYSSGDASGEDATHSTYSPVGENVSVDVPRPSSSASQLVTQTDEESEAAVHPSLPLGTKHAEPLTTSPTAPPVK